VKNTGCSSLGAISASPQRLQIGETLLRLAGNGGMMAFGGSSLKAAVIIAAPQYLRGLVAVPENGVVMPAASTWAAP